MYVLCYCRNKIMRDINYMTEIHISQRVSPCHRSTTAKMMYSESAILSEEVFDDAPQDEKSEILTRKPAPKKRPSSNFFLLPPSCTDSILSETCRTPATMVCLARLMDWLLMTKPCSPFHFTKEMGFLLMSLDLASELEHMLL